MAEVSWEVRADADMGRKMKSFILSNFKHGIRRMSTSMLTRTRCTRAPLVYSPFYSVPSWPKEHRFVMSKFHDLADELRREGYMDGPHVFEPVEPPKELIYTVHGKEYVDAFMSGKLEEKKLREIGFRGLWSTDLVRRTVLEVAGTVLASELALQHGIACNLGGGTHHAHRDYGSGFTIFNDLAVGAKFLIEHHALERILICDLDVHQGDGTAGIFADEPRVFTLSMHCQSNFPFRKKPSDLDIGLDDNVGDAEYLSVLETSLVPILDDFRPEFVLFDGGIDVHENDTLGRLKLTSEGLRARDIFVMTQCIKRGIPLAGVIGGGYSPDPRELAKRHSILHRSAQEVWENLNMSSMTWS